MANIPTYNSYGLFTPCYATPQTLISSGKTLEFSATLKDGKDPFNVIVYVPDTALGDHVLTCRSADGLKEMNFPLNVDSINIIPLTTQGIRKPDGTCDFVFSTNASNITSLNCKMCIVAHTEVENH